MRHLGAIMLAEINTILYASDLGEGSRYVFRHALQEAIKHDARIIFFHAVEPISDLTNNIIEDFMPEKLSEQHRNQVLNNNREKIKQRICDFLVDEIQDNTLLSQPPLIYVAIDKPFQGILSAANEKGADLIIMGDRESSIASRLFLGSTAQKVVHHSNIPVTIVPIKNR